MQAVIMTATGGPEVLRYQEVGDPVLRSDTEVLVRIKAAAVNPLDTKLRRKGTYYPDQLPCILGCDGAGIVEAVGSAVTRFQHGDEVYFFHGGIGGAQGNYAQFTAIDERYLALKPQTLDFTEAAAVPLVLITAWESLYDRGKLQQGQSVLIHAGAGGVGHVAIQLAKDAGAWVCTTVGDDEKIDFVRGLRADEVINYKQDDFVSAVLDWSEGDGVELCFDTVGGNVFTQSFAATRFYGDIVTLLQPAADTDWGVARQRNLRISLELMLSPAYFGLEEKRRRQTEILELGARLIDAGRLKVTVGRRFALEDAAHAHDLIERGGMLGKVVLVIE